MLQIRKSDPPACIADLQQTPGSDWGSVKGDQKREMREHLLREQGGLCAYCMRRVTNDEKKCTVEHWRPRSDEQTDPFHWPDLLAVCDGGGSGAKRDTAHCDRIRGDTPLTLHPAHPSQNIEDLLRYDADGHLHPIKDTPDVNTLNLNCDRLKGNRRAVIDAVLQGAQQADATALRRFIQRWEHTDKNHLRPEYAATALYFLRRRLQIIEKRSQRIRKSRTR